MDIERNARWMATTFRRGLAAVTLAALALTAPPPSPALLSDTSLDGFTVILEWLKQMPATPNARPVHETIATFLDRGTAGEYLAGRVPARDLATRARVLAWDGETSLGPIRLTSWEDDFVSTYKVANYQVAPGVSCP